MEWAGQGSIVGSQIVITLQPIASDVSGTVSLRGSVLTGSPPPINITLTGAVTASSTATQFAGSGVTPFAGSYTGTFEGSEAGTFNITISDTGSVSGSLDSPANGNGLFVTGSMQVDGLIHFQYHTQNGNSSYDGYVFMPPGVTTFTSKGTWSFQSMSGDWSASPTTS